MRTRPVLLPALVLATALLVAACSSSSSSSPTSAYCDQLNQVKSSYQTLIDTNVAMDGTQQLRDNFQALTDDLAAFKTAAGDRFAGDISNLQTSMTSLKSAIDDLVAGSGSVTTVTGALAGVKTSWDALTASVGSACSSS